MPKTSVRVTNCLDCSVDITDLHHKARRCPSCQKIRKSDQNKVAVAKPAARPCVEASDECTLGRLVRDRCPLHYGRWKHPLKGVAIFDCACRVCTKPFKAHREPRDICSERCKLYARKHPGHVDGPRYCVLCGASVPADALRSQKYCVLHSWATGSTRTATKAAARVVHSECRFCSRPLPESRAGRLFCSDFCDTRSRGGFSYADYVNRTCRWCGGDVPDERRVGATYCSTRCQVLINVAARRARKRGLPSEQIRAIEIFERDDWTCHICQEPVDPGVTGRRGSRSASLDHLIPLATKSSPGHVWANLACAHLGCNQGKRDRVTDADRALYQQLVGLRAAA